MGEFPTLTAVGPDFLSSWGTNIPPAALLHGPKEKEFGIWRVMYVSFCNVDVTIEYSVCQVLICELKSSQRPSEKGMMPILHMKSLRLREAK